MTVFDTDREAARIYRARVEYDILPHSLRPTITFSDYEPQDDQEIPTAHFTRKAPRHRFRDQLPKVGAVVTLHGRPGSPHKTLCPVWPVTMKPETGLVTLPLKDGTHLYCGPDAKWSYAPGASNG